MATTYLYRDYLAAQTDGSVATYSVWVKRSGLGSRNKIMGAYDGGAAGSYLEFFTDNTLRYHSGTGLNTTNAVFRDTSGWYHILVQHDSGGAGASDQVKIYVNGVLQSLSTNSGTTVDSQIGKNGEKTVIGVEESAYNSSFFDGLMSYVYYIDGTAYAPTVFGQTDSDTGEWTINSSPTVTMGNNGFLIMKDGNTITDQSTNSNDFTLGGGTLTNTEDCPDDVFCTFNPLDNKLSNIPTFINGNTTTNGSSSSWQPTSGTFGAKPNLGKFYWEYSQFVSDQIFVGLVGAEADFTITNPYATVGAITYFYTGRLTVDAVETESYFTAISSTTDVVGVALDMTAGTYGEAQFYLNGSTTGAAVALTSNFADQFVMPFAIVNGTGRYVSINTGNGYFATTIISSEGTNASGIGKFEHDVPTGYTALSTKGLQE